MKAPKKPLAKVQTRKEYMDTLAEMNAPSKRRRSGEGSHGWFTQLNAYALEVHELFKTGLGAKTEWEITDTGVDEIKILRVRHAKQLEPCQFYLDKTDERFLVLHTDEPAENAHEAMTSLVNEHDHKFDHTWFYSSLMKKWADSANGGFRGYLTNHGGALHRKNALKMDVNGTDAKIVYEELSKIGKLERLMSCEAIEMYRGASKTPSDHVEERIANTGHFKIKDGKSIQDHLHTVDECLTEYKSLVTDIEKQAMGLKTSNGSTFFDGKPFTITYQKIEKIEQFIDSMFTARKPFKLWGLKIKRKDDQYSVPAVDLHEGSALNFEISPEMMRVYFNKGGCGNTIMRLLTNLQIHYDATAKCNDLS